MSIAGELKEIYDFIPEDNYVTLAEVQKHFSKYSSQYLIGKLSILYRQNLVEKKFQKFGSSSKRIFGYRKRIK